MVRYGEALKIKNLLGRQILQTERGKIYTAYIQSPEWKHKRLCRLKIDEFKCRTCGYTKDEIQLEVHHVTYERFKNEEMGDLITLCTDCHTAITNVLRERKYKDNAEYQLTIIENIIRRSLQNVARATIPVDWIKARDDTAQRRTGKSNKQMGEIDESDFI